jgi:hypothetical protein
VAWSCASSYDCGAFSDRYTVDAFGKKLACHPGGQIREVARLLSMPLTMKWPAVLSAMELGAGSIGGNSVCIIALAKRLGAARWGDTVSFVYPFIPRTAVTPPDTTRVELRLP